MKNIIELRTALCELFDQIQNSEVTLARAKELANTAGKIIGSIKVELVYCALRKETPVIEFLGGSLSPEERNKLLSDAKAGVSSVLDIGTVPKLKKSSANLVKEVKHEAHVPS